MRRKMRSAPAIASRAWLYWFPMTAIGEKKMFASRKNMIRLSDRHVAVEDPPAAGDEQGGDEELAVQLEERGQDGGGAGEGDVVPGVVGQQAPEEARVGLLAHEALGHPDAVDRLGQGGRDAAEALLRGPGQPAELHPKMVVHHQRTGPSQTTTRNITQS